MVDVPCGMLPEPFSLPSLAEAVKSFFPQRGMSQAS